MLFIQIVLIVSIAFVVGVVGDERLEKKRVPKQISKGLVLDEDDEDRKAEGSGFENFGGFGGSGGGGDGGKYFMYQHVPKKDHYEFGFKRGNEHHWKERHEKAHPHVGHFKTKVKWGDKHGGHGEHYWDYNHHGHHGDEGGGSSGDDADEASERVNNYESSTTDDEKELELKKVSNKEGKTRQLLSSASNSQPTAAEAVIPDLVYNLRDGTVIDKNSQKVYLLYPVD